MSETNNDTKAEALTRIGALEKQLAGELTEERRGEIDDQLDQAFRDAEAAGATLFEVRDTQYQGYTPEERQKEFKSLIESSDLTLDELVKLRDKYDLEG